MRHRRRNNAHYDGVCSSLFENIHAKSAQPRNTVRDVRRTFFIKRLGSLFVAVEHDLRHCTNLPGLEHLEPLDRNALKIAGEFDLRRTAGGKDKVADFRIDRKHSPQYILKRAYLIAGSV